MFLAFPLGFLSAGLMLWKGALLNGDACAWASWHRRGRPCSSSLGWNFLVYTFDLDARRRHETRLAHPGGHLRDHGRRAVAQLVAGPRARPRGARRCRPPGRPSSSTSCRA